MKRLYDIDRAKGLAIFLVVLGHLVSRGVPPVDVVWYMNLRMLIYKFHMPFFMFLSGVIFYYSYRHVDSVKGYFTYSIKKINRLIPAYLVFGFVIIFGKIVASGYIYVDNVNYNVPDAIMDLFVFPSRSVAGSIWYIYVLLQLYLVFPLLINAARKNLFTVLIISAVLHFVPATDYFMLDRLFEYMLYFALGIIAISNYEDYQRVIDKHYKAFMFLFVISFASIILVNPELSKVIIGLCSIPALHGIVRNGTLAESGFLYLLGVYTYAIYLMNTITIGLAKGFLFEFIRWDGVNFLIFLPIMLLAGIVIPIMIKKYIFIRIPYLNKITS